MGTYKGLLIQFSYMGIQNPIRNRDGTTLDISQRDCI
jgi:hypothetical protein